MKNIIKAIYYLFFHPTLPKDKRIKLCFVFHTEQILYQEAYDKFKKFCQLYHTHTGKKIINTVMPFINPRIKAEAIKANISEQIFIDRINELSKWTDIGYHGHFYENNNLSHAIKTTYHYSNQVVNCFTNEWNWFKKHKINVQPVYSAGWWYMDENVLEALFNNNILYDFSLTYNNNFYNEYSQNTLNENDIEFGEIFYNKGIKHIQTLTGCHNTPYFNDFKRNLNKLLNQTNNNSIMGAICTHDYNLIKDDKNTINCLLNLLKEKNVSFFDLDDLKNNLV